MRKTFGVALLILVTTFGLLLTSLTAAIAKELMLLPGLPPTWVPKSRVR